MHEYATATVPECQGLDTELLEAVRKQVLCWCIDYFSEETAKVRQHIYPATAGALNRFLPVVEGHQRSDRERERKKQEQEVSARTPPFQREINASGANCQCS